MGLPVWRYELGQLVLEKRLLVPYRQNTVYVTYRLVSAPGPVGLRVRPAVHFRPHERPVSDPLADALRPDGPGRPVASCSRTRSSRGVASQDRTARRPRSASRATRSSTSCYPVEQSRGYEATGTSWSRDTSA